MPVHPPAPPPPRAQCAAHVCSRPCGGRSVGNKWVQCKRQLRAAAARAGAWQHTGNAGSAERWWCKTGRTQLRPSIQSSTTHKGAKTAKGRGKQPTACVCVWGGGASPWRDMLLTVARCLNTVCYIQMLDNSLIRTVSSPCRVQAGPAYCLCFASTPYAPDVKHRMRIG